MLWAFFVCTGSLASQDCGCIDCPADIVDQAISSATFRVNGAANNSLTSNAIQSVHLSFNHTFPSELEMRLISPAGQAVSLTGPQGTFASAVFFGGFNVSFVTDINETDPDPGMNNIWNNADLTGIQQYTGSYLPFSGSLLNFNTGTVNGDWILEITDPLIFDDGVLEEFEILFVDQEGIECCEADAGTLDTNELIACQGDAELIVSLNPIHINGAPNDAVYGYTYIITENDLIVAISENPDLSAFAAGVYNIYGFSFELSDEAQIPSPSGSLALTNFVANIEGNNPIICGDITSEFLEVEILGGASETFVRDTLCDGEGVFFGGEEIFIAGTYRDTFNTLSSCDSIVQLDIEVGVTESIELFESTCTQILTGIDTMIFNTVLGCDSLVIINTSLLPSDTLFLDTETCSIGQDMQVDTIIISTPECDSVIITTFFYEAPDTIFAINKTCFPDAVGFDTSLVNLGALCDDVQITETIVYLIDTTFLNLTTCDENELGEVIMNFPTDSCDRVEVTMFTLAASDTIFLEMSNCDQDFAGVDTLFLTNENNCDSLVITTITFVESDTLFFENFSCDPLDVGVDTMFLNNQFMCDSIIINITFLSLSDTTFIFENTCDINQTEPSVEIFTTADCDSLVITEFEFVEPDTIFTVELVCEEIDSDTILFQNFQGCDSLVITNFETRDLEPTVLDLETCDPSLISPQRDTLQGQFCDSIVVTNFILLSSDISRQLSTVCSLEEVGVDTLFFMNATGCDSLVIVERVFADVPQALITSFTCDQDALGLDTMILIASSGCDSLVITDFLLAEADTVFTETIFTCDMSEVGLDTLVFETSSCDSIVIMTTAFVALDTTMIEIGDCDLNISTLDTVDLISVMGCDSTILVNTVPLTPSITNLSEAVSLPSEVGMDTMFLQNNAGCDSLVITNFFLEMEVPDTVFVNIPTCEFNMLPDTTVGVVGEVVIEIPVPIVIDTTFLENEVCDESIIENDTSILSSVLGCDSVVVISFLPLSPSVINISQTTCNENQILIDTVFLQNQFGCDSLVVTNYEVVSIEPTMLAETTCDPDQELTETLVLTSVEGCDSLVITNYEVVSIEPTILEETTCDPDQELMDTLILTSEQGCDSLIIINVEVVAIEPTILEETTCDPDQELMEALVLTSEEGCDSLVVINYVLVDMDTIRTIVPACLELPSDTIMIDNAECPTVEITLFENLVSDTTFLSFENCVGPFGEEVLMFSNVFGCDSVVVQSIVEAMQSETIIEQNTCVENQVSDTLVFVGQFCDSLIITNFIFESIEPTVLETFTCDANDLIPDTIVLSSSLQCDSLVIFEKILVEFQATEVIEFTCEMSSAGIVMDTLTSSQGCDSIIVTSFIFEPMMPMIIETFTCDANDVFPDTLILSSSMQCDSLVIVEKILVELTPTELFSVTCDLSTAGTFMDTLISFQGCDSVIIETIDFVEQQEVTIEEFTCDETEVGLDTTFVNTGECPSLLIVETILQLQSDTVFLLENTCDQSLLGEIQTDIFTSQNGCDSIVIRTFTIESIDFGFDVSIDSPICEGEQNGKVEFSVQDGVEVLWLFDQQEISNRDDLPAGEYQVELSQNSCDTVIQIVIPPTPAIFLNLEIDYILCSSNGGVIFTQVAGGQDPYDYLWDDASIDPDRVNLPNGTYMLTVTDVMGCTSVDSVQIENVLGLDFQAEAEDVTCFGDDDGSIEISLQSGTPPFTALWNDGNEELLRNDLEPGTYSCTISDINNCNIILNRIVREPSLLGADLRVNASGEFEALVSGGTPQYSYLWNDGNTTSVIREPILGFAYEVTVTDANGCIAVRDEVFAQVSTLGIDLSDVILSPNPNNGTFQFSFDVTLDLEQIQIYNIYGQKIIAQINTLNDGNVEMALPPSQKGTFILDVEFKQGKYVQKLLVF